MAVGFLNNVDLNNNQVLNMRLQNLGTAPTGGGAVSGSIYFNSSVGVNRPAWNDGSTWHQIYPASSTATNNYLVLRDASGNAYANAFVGSLQGNSDTTTKLLTARNIGISGGKVTATPANFDGTAAVNINITALSVAVNEIGLTSGYFIIGDGSNLGSSIAKSSIPISGFGAATADVSFGGSKITNVAEPVNSTDAATKAYVDAAAVGLKVKEAAKYATAAALPAYSYTGLVIQATSNGALTVDGITPSVSDRILVKNEPSGAADPRNAKRNGIYTVTQVGSGSTPFILTRATDYDQSSETVPGSFVFVISGNTLANTGWVMSASGPITLDTSDIIWSQFSGAGQIDAGNGLTKTGNELNVVGTTNRIIANADSIDISPNYAGQVSITTLGTITQGTWQGATIAVNQGGTGLTAYNTGSLLYAGGSAVISQLAPVAVGNVLLSGGVSPALPSWGKVGLTTHVSGILPVSNGGTGAATLAENGILLGNGTGAVSSSTTSVAGQFIVSADTTYAPTWRSMSGDATLSGAGLLTIANNAVSYGKFQQVAGLSVVGNPNQAQGNVTAINAANDHQVLRRSGTGLAFGAINLASSSAVTGILPASNGGTGSQYFSVQNQSSSRVYTFNDTSCKIPAFFAATITGNGSATDFPVQHNIGSKDVMVYVYDASTGAQVFTDIVATTANSVTVTFAVAVANAKAYRVVVVGFGVDNTAP